MQLKKTILASFVLFLPLFFLSCDSKNKNTTTQIASKQIITPKFNADSAYHFVEAQVSFGPRVPGSKAHQATADYLEASMRVYADKVERQEFQAETWDEKKLTGWNIIASFNPEAAKRILLAAHWDSRPVADHDPLASNRKKPVPGANDGASGVGVLMEIARAMSAEKPTVGIDIIFFDLEDYGVPTVLAASHHDDDTWCLGSQHWAQYPHKANYRASYGILLDMVGHPNAKFTKEATSMYYAVDIMDKVWMTAQNLGYSKFFSQERTGAIIDDHLYINKMAKLPMIDIIHYDPHTPTRFFPHWHTINDDMEHIDKNTLEIVGKTVLHVIYNE